MSNAAEPRRTKTKTKVNEINRTKWHQLLPNISGTQSSIHTVEREKNRKRGPKSREPIKQNLRVVRLKQGQRKEPNNN